MLDPNTKRHIADALWADSFEESGFPSSISDAINDPKNSNSALGARIRTYLQWLKDHPQDNNPDYRRRYQALIDVTRDINPQQAYIISSFLLGNNATQGYDPMPAVANLTFPRDHEPKFKTKVGWHFFVGSAWDETGQEYGVEVMFFRVAVMPPALAEAQGLTDVENQVVEIQLGISKAGERHHQADPVVVAGTTGLIEFAASPFAYSIGQNKIRSELGDKFLPLNIQAHGVDRGDEQDYALGVDLTFTEGKEYLLQGADGCSPCIAGMGTLYYSIPNMVMKPGSTITYGGEVIKLERGTFWFDHQWGFLNGNPNSRVLRAASNIKKPNPAGWDWYMAQFNGDRQVTMSALHSDQCKAFYFQTGQTPPPTMVVPVTGKYFDENKNMTTCKGVLTIDRWVRSEQSPNPELYLITNAWHPDHWEFEFDETLPEDIRQFSMEQIVPVAQTNFFANGCQYNEGAVYLKSKAGEDIGRGFAEAVQYADPTANMYHILGYVDKPELQCILGNNTASLLRKARSFLYVLTHKAELEDTLANAKGLEMLGSKPDGARGHQHTSRY